MRVYWLYPYYWRNIIYILQIFLRLLAQKEHILLFSDFSKHRKNQPSTTSLSAKIIARHPPQNCFAKMWIQIQQAGYVYIYIYWKCSHRRTPWNGHCLFSLTAGGVLRLRFREIRISVWKARQVFQLACPLINYSSLGARRMRRSFCSKQQTNKQQQHKNQRSSITSIPCFFLTFAEDIIGSWTIFHE